MLVDVSVVILSVAIDRQDERRRESANRHWTLQQPAERNAKFLKRVLSGVESWSDTILDRSLR
jgi:hypothetical protein